MIVLINPNLIAQKNDLLTTGIVYMPISLAYFAGVLRKNSYEFKVIDAFGENPSQIRVKGNFVIQGLNEREVVGLIPETIRIIFIYASNISYYISLVSIVKEIRQKFPEVPVVVIENTQAVTSYSLREVQEDLYKNGIDYILTGEPEKRGIELIESIINKNAGLETIDGIGYKLNNETIYRYPKKRIENLDEISFPAWDFFPLNNYWKLKYSHGPLETGKYLPLLSSRGCPYGCRFCLMPCVSNRKWISRSAKNIAAEMEYSLEHYGVSEFHFEDVNPTVSETRIRELCKEIMNRKLKIIWKLVSGTKVETIKNEETIDLMAKAGCNYISISPETGSKRILQLMNKPFDLEHAVNIIKKMYKSNIFSQACFVLGFPGEDNEDIKLTEKMVKKLTRVGVDEIAVFIVTPVPGADLFAEFKGYYNFSQLTFSPDWRKDYNRLNMERIKLYVIFLLYKTLFNFSRIAVQPLRFMKRTFKTKMEMIPYRALKMKVLIWRAKNGL